MAKHPRATEEVLAKLARHKNHEVRKMVAESPRVTPRLLTRLARDKAKAVRAAIARNPQTPEEAFLRLARDRSPEVWEEALRRLPKPFLEELYQKELLVRLAGKGNLEKLKRIEELLG
ncbi:hypothetical protein [Thermus thermophilus]|uniref:variant leucine-rich repeat-containing protein n=1 Tax=Thermus thermophilus TaxID=274 RepID=UPI001FAF604F